MRVLLTTDRLNIWTVPDARRRTLGNQTLIDKGRKDADLASKCRVDRVRNDPGVFSDGSDRSSGIPVLQEQACSSIEDPSPRLLRLLLPDLGAVFAFVDGLPPWFYIEPSATRINQVPPG